MFGRPGAATVTLHTSEESGQKAGRRSDIESEQYRPALHRFLLGRLKNAEDASDLAQETFLRYYSISNAEAVSRPDNYLFRIAVNLLYEFRLRRDRDNRFVTFSSQLSETSLESLLDDDPTEALATQQQLAHVLAQIPAAYRQVLVLHKRDGLSCKEIAAQLNLSVRSVEKYVARALAHARNASWEPNKDSRP
jgi:RNA polymerase sigma factor (sigma-70 family)